jgi:hypothetical protein
MRHNAESDVAARQQDLQSFAALPKHCMQDADLADMCKERQ